MLFLLLGVLQCASGEPSTGAIETMNSLVSGKVKYPSGEAAADVSVTLCMADYTKEIDGATDGEVQHYKTDKDGNLHFNVIDAGEFVLEINDDSAFASLVTLSIKETTGDTTINDQILQPYAMVSGVVHSPSDSDEELVVQIPGMDRVTDVIEGEFTFADLPEGEYSLQVVSPTNSEQILDEIEVEVVANDTTTVVSFPSWDYKSEILINTTVTGANIEETLYSFPVLIQLNSENMDFTVTQNAGEDIRITKPNSESLPFEIEAWDAAAQTASIWVLVDTLYAQDTTVLMMKYGNSTAESKSNGMDVFNGDYAGVWHLNDSTRVMSSVDATTDGENFGTATVDGVIGSAYNFYNQSYALLQKEAFTDLDTDISISFWQYGIGGDSLAYNSIFDARPSDTSDTRILTSHMPWSVGETHRFYWYAASTDDLDNRLFSGIEIYEFEGQWNHWTLTKDGTIGDMKAYLNGELWNTDGDNFTSMSGIGIFKLGSLGNDDKTKNYEGYLDEFRVSNIARSESWIKMNYENQKIGSSVVTVQ